MKWRAWREMAACGESEESGGEIAASA